MKSLPVSLRLKLPFVIAGASLLGDGTADAPTAGTASPVTDTLAAADAVRLR